MSTKVQLRGHCPHCGTEHAVMGNGTIATHNSSLEYGWFTGVCTGTRQAPMEFFRDETEKVSKKILDEVQKLQEELEALKSGAKKPELAPESLEHDAKMIPFAKATAKMKARAVEIACRVINNRILAGIKHSNHILDVLDKVHGQSLRELVLEKRPNPFRIGEQRILATGHIVTAIGRQGSRVHWKDETGSDAWIGVRQWITLDPVQR